MDTIFHEINDSIIIPFINTGKITRAILKQTAINLNIYYKENLSNRSLFINQLLLSIDKHINNMLIKKYTIEMYDKLHQQIEKIKQIIIHLFTIISLSPVEKNDIDVHYNTILIKYIFNHLSDSFIIKGEIINLCWKMRNTHNKDILSMIYDIDCMYNNYIKNIHKNNMTNSIFTYLEAFNNFVQSCRTKSNSDVINQFISLKINQPLITDHINNNICYIDDLMTLSSHNRQKLNFIFENIYLYHLFIPSQNKYVIDQTLIILKSKKSTYNKILALHEKSIDIYTEIPVSMYNSINNTICDELNEIIDETEIHVNNILNHLIISKNIHNILLFCELFRRSENLSIIFKRYLNNSIKRIITGLTTIYYEIQIYSDYLNGVFLTHQSYTFNMIMSEIFQSYSGILCPIILPGHPLIKMRAFKFQFHPILQNILDSFPIAPNRTLTWCHSDNEMIVIKTPNDFTITSNDVECINSLLYIAEGLYTGKSIDILIKHNLVQIDECKNFIYIPPTKNITILKIIRKRKKNVDFDAQISIVDIMIKIDAQIIHYLKKVKRCSVDDIYTKMNKFQKYIDRSLKNLTEREFLEIDDKNMISYIS